MNAVVEEDRPSQLVVVVGASAGGIEALQRFVRALPPNLPLALLIVLHVPASGSLLPQILARVASYPAAHAVDGEPIQPGRIMIAPPDHHLVVEERVVRVRRTQREDGYRPAIDTLFRSAAEALGPNVVGVILSGALSDGAQGLATIKRHGGLTLVQDPDEARYGSMPQAAIHAADPHHVLPVAELAALVAGLGIRGGVAEASQSPS
jgi:two-component system chemotaxis response regulator CheB